MKREEKEVKLRMILQDYHRRNDYELQQAVNDILALDALPPAEGAEEILDRLLRDYPWQHWGRENALKAMQEFATLHAQKIADKMVSERLRDELALYHRWIQKNKYTNIIHSHHECAAEYLKSREK
jgi:hypothetical protein